jgi:hypothetical protein
MGLRGANVRLGGIDEPAKAIAGGNGRHLVRRDGIVVEPAGQIRSGVSPELVVGVADTPEVCLDPCPRVTGDQLPERRAPDVPGKLLERT